MESKDKAILYKIFDNSSFPMFILNREGRIIYCNKKFKKFLGYLKEEIRCQDVFSFVPEEFNFYFKYIYRTILNSSKPLYYREYVVPFKVFKEKEQKTVYTQLFLGKTSLNDNFLLIGIIKGETEDPIGFHHIRELVYQANVSMVITNIEGNIIFVNPYFEKTTGYKKEEVLGKNVNILKSGKHPREFYDKFWNTILGGKEWRGVFINRKKDGTLFYEDSVVFPMKNEDGEILSFGSIRKDVTDKVILEERIRERAKKLERFQSFLVTITGESLSDTYSFEDAVKSILENASLLIDADKALLLMFNSDKSELFPVDVFLKKKKAYAKGFVTREIDLPKYFDKVKRAEEEFSIINAFHNIDIWTEIREFFKKTGLESQDISIIDIPVRVENEVVGILSFESLNSFREWSLDEQVFAKYMADLVSLKLEQKRREEIYKALLSAKEETERASRAKNEFLSRMSHELRTPLNAILGFSQLLYEEVLGEVNESQKDVIKDIITSGKHLLDLINEILDFSRIESGRITLSIEDVNLKDIIDEVVALVYPLAMERDIKIINNASKKEEMYVKADYTRLKQVLINLLSNAIKYNKKGGIVEIDALHLNNFVKISVKDTGIGIPKDKIERLFEPFDRLGKEATLVEGTGIGLTITKRLVELMGGSIDVESELNVGSTFSIMLIPSDISKKEERVILEKEKDFSLKEARDKEYRILYIEDNLSNLKLVAKILYKRPHISLISSGQGRMGVDLAIAHRPDLVLVDINLPDISGYEVLKILKNSKELKDVPIIALTADVITINSEKAREMGFDGFIPKPINVKEFLHIIDTFLP